MAKSMRRWPPRRQERRHQGWERRRLAEQDREPLRHRPHQQPAGQRSQALKRVAGGGAYRPRRLARQSRIPPKPPFRKHAFASKSELRAP